MVYDLYTYTFADGRTLTINTAWIGVTPVLQLKPSWTDEFIFVNVTELESLITTIQNGIAAYVANYTAVMAELTRLGFQSQYGHPLFPAPGAWNPTALPAEVENAEVENSDQN